MGGCTGKKINRIMPEADSTDMGKDRDSGLVHGKKSAQFSFNEWYITSKPSGQNG